MSGRDDKGQSETIGTGMEARMVRGWRLTKAAWAVIRRDPTMVSIALLGAGCGLLGAAAIFHFSGYSPGNSRGSVALTAAIALYPLTFLSVFFNVALAGAAVARLEGRPISLRGALGISTKRIGRIAQWALLAAGVGLVLEQIASRIPGAGRLVSWLLGAAWSLATIFAVPLLVLKGEGPFDTAKESVHLIKDRWGEGVTGLVGIHASAAIVTIPAAILFVIGIVTADATLGVALIALSVGAFLLVTALTLATQQVFAVALYRYATGVPGTGDFAVADLEDPFRRRDRS